MSNDQLSIIEQPVCTPTIEQTPSASSTYLIVILGFSLILSLFLAPLYSPLIKLLYSDFISSRFGSKTEKRFKQLQASGIVRLTSDNSTYGFILSTSELREDFTGELNLIDVIMPQVDGSEKVEYVKELCNIEQLEIVEGQSLAYKILVPLVPVLTQRFDSQKDIIALKMQQERARELSQVVKSSDLYASNSDIYLQDIRQIEKAIIKIQDLQVEQDKYIRNNLIAVKIAEFDLKAADASLAMLDLQKQQLQEECQQTKDFVNAYLELKA